MAKGKKPGPVRGGEEAGTRGVEKELQRLERRLARVRATESKREHQLGRARAAATELEARLTALRLRGQLGSVEVGPDATPVPEAYCMREKRKVVIAGAENIVLKNGRAAVTGTCSHCGARVVTTARSVVALVAHG